MHVRIVAVRFCNIVLKHQEKYQRSPWFVVLRVKMRKESTKERLMTLALNKYVTLTSKNVWNNPSEEEQQIIALTAQLKTVKESHLKLV